MLLRITLSAVAIYLYSLQIFAQPRFTQFYSTPLFFNPAATGRFNKDYRIAIATRLERTSLKTAFSQNAFAVDFKAFSSKLPEYDCFSFGLNALDEKSTSEGIKNSYLGFSMSYNKSLDDEGKHQLTVGFQTQIANKRLLPSNVSHIK
jgi:Type IX secretion system membrane protein PorP/SprF